MNKDFYNRFLDIGDRSKAVCDLASLGEEGVSIVRDLLNGHAKNKYGVPYCEFGIAVDCAIVAADRLRYNGVLLDDVIELIKSKYKEHMYTKEFFSEK